MIGICENTNMKDAEQKKNQIDAVYAVHELYIHLLFCNLMDR